MAAKGSRLSRAIQYFIDGDLEECRYVLSRATDIMVKRNGADRVSAPAVKTRKTRRTKAQMAVEVVIPGMEESDIRGGTTSAYHGG